MFLERFHGKLRTWKVRGVQGKHTLKTVFLPQFIWAVAGKDLAWKL